MIPHSKSLLSHPSFSLSKALPFQFLRFPHFIDGGQRIRFPRFIELLSTPLSNHDVVNLGVQLPSSNEEESIADRAEGIPQSLQHIDDIHEELPEVNENHEPHIGTTEVHSKWGRKELCIEDRVAAYNMLLAKSVNGKLKKTTTGEVAAIFNVKIRSIQRLWRRGQKSSNHDVSHCRVKNCGRKRIESDLQKIRDIPLRNRTTLKTLSAALGVSKTYLHNKLRTGELKCHSNSIIPSLTEANRVQRVRHCLSLIDPDSAPSSPSFQHMENVVHIDEKWFQNRKKN